MVITLRHDILSTIHESTWRILIRRRVVMMVMLLWSHQGKSTVKEQIMVNTENENKNKPVYAVYEDDKGTLHTQPLSDIQDAGILIDEDSGDDLNMIGYTFDPFDVETHQDAASVVLF